MSALIRRTCLAFVLALVLLTTGGWQSDQVALAKSQAAGLPETPLFPGLTWSGPELSTQTVRINARGDSISLPGERYTAREQFTSDLPLEVLNYYSNEQLAKSGWDSYDVVEGSDGIHYVYYHDSGTYLSVEYLKCPKDPSSTCVAIWKSEQTAPATAAPGKLSEPKSATISGPFGKTAPSNGSTGLNPASITLSWTTSSGAAKYAYCVKDGSACASNDPNWTSTFNKSITLTNLATNKTYYWQVRATSCSTCVPKPWVYADNGTVWHFSTKTGAQVTIMGNAGVGRAVLSYTDVSLKNVIADSSGAYSIKVPLHWTGTITPSKAGYIFSPASASFTDLTATQTIQNFNATVVYVISGNAGLAGVTLSYIDGTPKTVVSDANGNYSISVLGGWSGTVTPSKIGYIFTPASRTYSNLSANQTAQNYTAAIATFTISGNAGIGGVTLKYTNGTPLAVISDARGNYSITVLFGWSGTVTPTHPCFTFNPTSQTYTHVGASQANQNYTPALRGGAGCADINVSIGGPSQGRFGVPPHRSTRANFTGINNGPVKINSTNAASLIAGERLIYQANNIATSFSEMMALPDSQVDTTYWLPWYNNVDLDTQLRIANVTTNQTATVHLWIGGHEMINGCTPFSSPFTLQPGQSIRVRCPVNDGPVEIISNQNIVASERLLYKVNGVNTSFTEMMALPDSQVDTTYWLPWYNNVDLDTQLRIANVSNTNQTATVHLYIGGQEVISGCTPFNSPFTLAAGESIRVRCPLNNGPVEIRSDQNIVAAERVIYRVNGIDTSFSEMMAVPAGQLNTTYWLPWYNNVDLDTQLRIANVSNTNQTATVHLYIGGQEVTSGCTPFNSPFTLAAGESIRVRCAGKNNGSVKIQSNISIVAAERVIYRVNGIDTSFSEMMALPNSQLNAIFWLPWYNSVELDSQLRFGVP